MWHGEKIGEKLKMLLSAGEHIYQLIDPKDQIFSSTPLIRILDPESMQRKTDLEEEPFIFLSTIFKLTEECVLIGSQFAGFHALSTGNNEVVQTLTLESRMPGG